MQYAPNVTYAGRRYPVLVCVYLVVLGLHPGTCAGGSASTNSTGLSLPSVLSWRGVERVVESRAPPPIITHPRVRGGQGCSAVGDPRASDTVLEDGAVVGVEGQVAFLWPPHLSDATATLFVCGGGLAGDDPRAAAQQFASLSVSNGVTRVADEVADRATAAHVVLASSDDAHRLVVNTRAAAVLRVSSPATRLSVSVLEHREGASVISVAGASVGATTDGEMIVVALEGEEGVDEQASECQLMLASRFPAGISTLPFRQSTMHSGEAHLHVSHRAGNAVVRVVVAWRSEAASLAWLVSPPVAVAPVPHAQVRPRMCSEFVVTDDAGLARFALQPMSPDAAQYCHAMQLRAVAQDETADLFVALRHGQAPVLHSASYTGEAKVGGREAEVSLPCIKHHNLTLFGLVHAAPQTRIAVVLGVVATTDGADILLPTLCNDAHGGWRAAGGRTADSQVEEAPSFEQMWEEWVSARHDVVRLLLRTLEVLVRVMFMILEAL